MALMNPQIMIPCSLSGAGLLKIRQGEGTLNALNLIGDFKLHLEFERSQIRKWVVALILNSICGKEEHHLQTPFD